MEETWPPRPFTPPDPVVPIVVPAENPVSVGEPAPPDELECRFQAIEEALKRHGIEVRRNP